MGRKWTSLSKLPGRERKYSTKPKKLTSVLLDAPPCKQKFWSVVQIFNVRGRLGRGVYSLQAHPISHSHKASYSAICTPKEEPIRLCTVLIVQQRGISMPISAVASKQLNEHLHANEVTAPPFTASSGWLCLSKWTWTFRIYKQGWVPRCSENARVHCTSMWA